MDLQLFISSFIVFSFNSIVFHNKINKYHFYFITSVIKMFYWNPLHISASQDIKMWYVNYKLYYSAVILSFTGIYGSSLQYVYTILYSFSKIKSVWCGVKFIPWMKMWNRMHVYYDDVCVWTVNFFVFIFSYPWI